MSAGSASTVTATRGEHEAQEAAVAARLRAIAAADARSARALEHQLLKGQSAAHATALRMLSTSRVLQQQLRRNPENHVAVAQRRSADGTAVGKQAQRRSRDPVGAAAMAQRRFVHGGAVGKEERALAKAALLRLTVISARGQVQGAQLAARLYQLCACV